MLKFLTTMFLLTCIFLIAMYIALYLLFNLTDFDNSINVLYRKKFLPYPFIRSILKLHQVGDARFDYATDTQYTSLTIRLYHIAGESLEEGTLDKVKEEIGKIVQKSEGILVEEPVLLNDLPETLTDTDLREISKRYRRQQSITGGNISLSIFLLGTYAPHPTNVGIVMDAYSIFIFKDAVRDIAHLQVSNRSTEVSTILHEFAHQLGAEHINIDGCILSEKLEDVTFFNLPSVITEEYCENDLREIRRAIN